MSCRSGESSIYLNLLSVVTDLVYGRNLGIVAGIVVPCKKVCDEFLVTFVFLNSSD